MFYDVLQTRCQECNVKLTPLLKELGLSTGAISRWRSGTIPNGEILMKLADRLNCSIDYLLGRTNEKTPAPEIGDGLDEQGRTLIQFWDGMSQEQRAALLLLLQARVERTQPTSVSQSAADGRRGSEELEHPGSA